MIGRRAFAAGAATALLNPVALSRSACPEDVRARPSLYSYPAAYRRHDGAVMLGPLALDRASFTTLFPTIAELDGVVLMPLWSIINSAVGRFDFGLIERGLDFWGRQGRSVVVGIVTVGYPVMVEAGCLRQAAPAWVLERVRTFRQSVSVLGPVRPLVTARQDIPVPIYWDPKFQAAQRTMIEAFARFDGHPGLASVRISTGITGEDNPTFDGLANTLPGFSNAHWLDYTHQVTAIYRAAFRRTPLEFDIDRVGFIRALGSNTDRSSADAFVDEIVRARIMLAMDGFDPRNVGAWHAGVAGDGPAASLRYVVKARQGGDRVGLEGGGLAQVDRTNIEALVSAFRAIRANRMVVFNDGIAALSLRRYGPTPATAASAAVWGEARLAAIADKGSALLEGISV